MPSESVAGFLDRAQASRVLFPEQVQQLMTQPDLPQSDLNAFCEFMFSRGVLTRFQATALREHRGHELSYGGYPIIDEIGPCPGGMAYRGLHPSLRTPLVIRRLRNDWLAPIDNPTNYLARARSFGMLAHPNIVHLLDVGTQGDEIYLVIEQPADTADLETLALEIGGAMPGFLAAEYGRAIASALRPAHEHGGTHGAIRPSNLIIGPLNTKLNSQGKQRRRPAPDAVVRLAELGLVPVRPPAAAFPNELSPYLAPERLDSPNREALGDIYSLGATLFFLLAGRPPFSTNETELENKIRTKTPSSLSSLRPDLSPDFVALIAKMLEKDPAKRPASAHEVEIALSRFCRAPAPPPNPPTAPIASPVSGVGYGAPIPSNGVAHGASPELVAVPVPGEEPIASELSDEWGVGSSELMDAQSSAAAAPRKPRAMSDEEKSRSKMLLLLGGLLHITAVTMLVLWLAGVFNSSDDGGSDPEPTKPTKKSGDGKPPKKTRGGNPN
jgi:serine/threonine protein kinase